MDRSFLSHPAVVAASREFVCARLATYESAEEGEFLEGIFTGRAGTLENTVFTILSPDGQRKLVRAGRSPSWAFRDGDDMATSMAEIARDHPGRTRPSAIPYAADLRRGINIASCDIQPLVIVFASSSNKRTAMERSLARLAWNEPFIGAFAYATTSGETDLEAVAGDLPGDGIAVVQPDAFGQKATVLSSANGSDAAALRRALEEGLEQFSAEAKDSRQLNREGRREGVHWETEIPVTDSHRPSRR